MKFLRLIGLTIVVAGIMFAAFAQGEESNNPCATEETRYVRTTKLTNAYEQLNPRSPIIRVVKRGEYLECISAGSAWFRVRIDGREGFIEVKDGVLRDSKGNPYLFIGLIIAVLLVGCVGCIVLFVKKGQATSA